MTKAITTLKLLASGWVVLVGAIGANALASALSLDTWYSFLSNPSVSFLSLVWLFLLYPLILGLLTYLTHRLFWK